MNIRDTLKQCGAEKFQKQIREAGGIYTTEEVSEFLGIPPNAVQKRLEQGCLLAVPFENNYGYPIWQFDKKDVVDHFSEIMAILNTSLPIGITQFFLTYDEDLESTPIEALKSCDPNQLEIVKLLAQQFYQQVAR